MFARFNFVLIAVICFFIFSCGGSSNSSQSNSSQNSSAGDGAANSNISVSFSSIAGSSSQAQTFTSCVPTQMSQAVEISWPTVASGATGNITVSYTLTCTTGPSSNIFGTISTGGASSSGLTITASAGTVCNDAGGSVQWQITIVNSTNQALPSASATLGC